MLLAGVEVLEGVGGRNDGEIIIRREEGVLIIVVVGVGDRKMPVIGYRGHANLRGWWRQLGCRP